MREPLNEEEQELFDATSRVAKLIAKALKSEAILGTSDRVALLMSMAKHLITAEGKDFDRLLAECLRQGKTN